ncbi:MAG: dihydrolipoyl dehydrogenase family protein, partial [Geminicoccaceae bacterium]
MTDQHVLKADIAIIGAGSGGLSVAAGAAQMGAKVVLIEKGKMGGDCLNYGCVPSKALIAAGEAAETVRTSGKFGVNGHEPDIDFTKVNGHVHDVIAGIAPHDSVERFEELGVQVIQAAGRFISPTEIEAGAQRIKARRFVIATGSSAFIPPLPGLDDVPYLTNETIFSLTDAPEHLIVVGGGPIGIEMAQAHRRLGVEVTLIEGGTIMGKDDPDAVAVVRRRLIDEGVVLREGAKVESVVPRGNGVSVLVSQGGQSAPVDGSHLLLAVGRRSNVAGLGLEAAGIEHTARGITVDARLRSSNKKVFAIGDVAGGYQFTHMAGYHGGIVIRNAMFN